MCNRVNVTKRIRCRQIREIREKRPGNVATRCVHSARVMYPVIVVSEKYGRGERLEFK